MDDAVDRLRADYDAVPYESHAYPQSAPGQLAAIAHVFGLHTPALSNARVLEIGCSGGGNLFPFAAWHPHARVVGVDLAAVHIDHGRQRAQALGLTNLILLQGDIATMDLSELGPFDFIICHGVYSWVPERVQRAILSVVRRSLAADGVAYVSYNVYPGWKAKEIIRDAMMLRGSGRTSPTEKLSYARGMIDFLEQVAPPDSVLARALADDRAVGAHARDYYVLHDYLEAFNLPSYFQDFGRRCETYGLTYLADAMPQTMFAVNYGQKIAEPLLKECGYSQVLVEQYLDFFVNRAFRQSLLVHTQCASQLRYQIDRKRFGDLHFAAWLPPTGEPTRIDDSAQEYGEHGLTLAPWDPGVKAALDALTARWPWTLSRPELVFAVHSRLAAAGVAPADDENEKIDELLEALITRGMVRYRLEPVVPEATVNPLQLDESVRRCAELVQTDEEARVFNRWHEEVPLPPVDRHLLPLLDGTRDRNALADELMIRLRKDEISFERNGLRLWGEVELREAALEYIDGTPHRLRQMKLA
jgi:SAM-dependent methyltransferase